MKVTGISWVGVGTDRYAETSKLFTQVLGLEIETEVEGQALLRTVSGQQVELFGREGRGKTLNTPPTIAFEVENVPSARQALIDSGVEIVGEIGSWNGHEWLYFRSPDGYLFEVKQSPPIDRCDSAEAS